MVANAPAIIVVPLYVGYKTDPCRGVREIVVGIVLSLS